jgi:transcriptional regulator with XRE-family HTH domain
MQHAMRIDLEPTRLIPIRLTPFIPAIVVYWRRLRGMTQEALAKEAGLCLSTLKKIEAGRKHGPWLDSLELICEALGITLLELLAGAERLATQAQPQAQPRA